jgi:hypothetical protein
MSEERNSAADRHPSHTHAKSKNLNGSADQGGEVAKPPATIQEAILTLLWPLRKRPLGFISLMISIITLGLYMVMPKDIVENAFDSFYAEARRMFAQKTTLIVNVPDNLWSLRMSVADFESEVQKRTGIIDVSFISPSGYRNIEAMAVLSTTSSVIQDGVKLSVDLKSGDDRPLGSASEIMPLELVDDAGRFFFDSVLRNLDVSWTTFASQRSPHRDNPIAFALLQASQVNSVKDIDAIVLLNKALKVEPNFSTAHWVLGTKFMRVGKSDDAQLEFETARRIDPDVPDFEYTDPTEAIRRILEKSHWDEIEKGVSFLKVDQPDYGVVILAWRLNIERFSFKIVARETETGEDLNWLKTQPGVVLAFNAGRFEKDPDARLRASGLLIINGKTENDPWKEQSGGALEFTDTGRAIIIPARELISSKVRAQYAVQGKPIMIEPGGKWAMVTNDHYKQNRTAVC